MTAYDIAVIGGGVFGLQVARVCAEHGMKTVLLEQNTIASGASNGLVGALMPHVPSQWNEKKQFQFEALLELSRLAEELQEATGQSLGYARTGRLMPIYSEDKLSYARMREEESALRWRTEQTGFSFRVLDASPNGNWLTPAAAPLGFIFDNFAARANPRAYCAALHTYLKSRVTILENTGFASFDEATSQIKTTSGDIICAEKLVYSAGYQGFDLIERATGEKIGKGVKGQSLSLAYSTDKPLPVIYDDGIYVIAHENGTVALGSTSENEWTHTLPEEEALAKILSRAIAFCPELKEAEIIDRWAGIRPKCLKRDPVVGRLPHKENTFVATGGFKISYGIAHRIAAALLQEIDPSLPKIIDLPASFTCAHHFKSAD
ncbi:NAD(P)/FAD-dependent oxidoreductase [Polycladidibacter hongkongensis]|uniref:NAD(P)/FAD-dependent oxidoreductase n=1 Tax=Polycladidibacter hongkongensis TaxID=1647556 RepID=UPI000837A6D2|nr:FAD-dependent oxidoreductase [Pseudovibrio hongkongensis]